MSATISAGVFIVTAILVILLVVVRIAVQSYGYRLGTDDVHFDQLPDPDHKRARYAKLRRICTTASVVIGVWIILLGVRMMLGAWTDHFAAARLGARSPGQVAGALGMVVVFAGVGVIAVHSTLRWDRRPNQILDPRPAIRVPIARRPASHTETDFSALTQASGDAERPRPAIHWYNANPAALWGMLAVDALVFLCYLALFILTVSRR